MNERPIPQWELGPDGHWHLNAGQDPSGEEIADEPVAVTSNIAAVEAAAAGGYPPGTLVRRMGTDGGEALYVGTSHEPDGDYDVYAYFNPEEVEEEFWGNGFPESALNAVLDTWSDEILWRHRAELVAGFDGMSIADRSSRLPYSQGHAPVSPIWQLVSLEFGLAGTRAMTDPAILRLPATEDLESDWETVRITGDERLRRRQMRELLHRDEEDEDDEDLFEQPASPRSQEEHEEALMQMGFEPRRLPDGTTHWHLMAQDRVRFNLDQTSDQPTPTEEETEAEERADAVQHNPLEFDFDQYWDGVFEWETTANSDAIKLLPGSNELRIDLDRLPGGNYADFVVLSHKGREWRIPLKQALPKPQLPPPGGDRP